MSYTITASTSAGAVALKRENAAAALKKARELREQGYGSVQITDGSTGALYDENSLARSLNAE